MNEDFGDFGGLVEQWLAGLGDDVPYTRPGEPGLLLTAEQWANYDEHQRLADRMETKYGAMFPELTGAVRNVARHIW